MDLNTYYYFFLHIFIKACAWLKYERTLLNFKYKKIYSRNGNTDIYDLPCCRVGTDFFSTPFLLLYS